MTRKDYEVIARALRAAQSGTEDMWSDVNLIGAAKWQRARTLRYVVDALAADNPAFDRARFVAAARDAE